MKFRAFGGHRPYVLRLDEGEEIVSTLERFLAEQNIRLGYFIAFGGFSSVELDYFNVRSKNYEKRQLDKQLEVVSLLGNIALAEVHGHCHQKALIKMDCTAQVLQRLGLDFELLDTGCCGMAGSFGFEREHFQISMQVGELALLPAVRKAAPDTLIITDGFSCREQIVQATGREPLHLAQVVQMALRHGSEQPEQLGTARDARAAPKATAPTGAPPGGRAA